MSDEVHSKKALKTLVIRSSLSDPSCSAGGSMMGMPDGGPPPDGGFPFGDGGSPPGFDGGPPPPPDAG